VTTLSLKYNSDQSRAWFAPTAESQAHFRAKILPRVGRIASDAYATNQLGSNIGAADSSGYVEIEFWYPEASVRDDSPGFMPLFEANDKGSNSRYFSVQMSDHRIYLDVQNGTDRRLAVSASGAVNWKRGFNKVRWTSDGDTYTLTVNSESIAVTMSLGSNDGEWLGDFSAGVDNVTVGRLERATNVQAFATQDQNGLIAYVDYNNKNKWIFSSNNGYVYDVIGGVHLTYAGGGTYWDYADGGSTYPLLNGYTTWSLASNPDIQVPLGSDGSALSLTPGTDIEASYVQGSDTAGSTSGWNSANALIDFRQVSPSNAFQYGIDYGTADLNTNSGTRTWFLQYSHYRMGTNGKLRAVEFFHDPSANTSAFKLQIWRLIGSTYTLIHNVDILSLLPATTGITKVTLDDPLTVKSSDFVALCVTNSSTDNILKSHFQGSIANATLTSDAERATGFDWSTGTDASANLAVRAYIDGAAVVAIGDSNIAGSPNTASVAEGYANRTAADDTPAYQIALESPYLTVLNIGIGGDTLSDILETWQDYGETNNPALVVMNGGTNDVAGGETDNSVILADYEAVVDAVNAQGIPVVALSVYPYSNGTNAQGAQIDDLNALISTMMTGKNGIFVDVTSTIGQFRAGGDVGNLWDIKTAYDADGVHLNADGDAAVGSDVVAAIEAEYDIGPDFAMVALDRSDPTYANSASRSADSYDAARPFAFSAADLADPDALFEGGHVGTVSTTTVNSLISSITVNGDNSVNDLYLWRGAVEPAESSPSGNQVATWRGAVEPAGATGGGNPSATIATFAPYCVNEIIGVDAYGVKVRSTIEFMPGTVVPGRFNNQLIYVKANEAISSGDAVAVGASFTASASAGGFTALYAIGSGEYGWVAIGDLS